MEALRDTAAWLAALQLALVQFLCVAVGLAIYGSEFGTPAGRAYLVALPIALALGVLPWSPLRALARTPLAPLVALGGVAAAAFAYRPLHMRSWDERSLEQALAVGALSLFSAFGAAAGAERLRAVPGRRGLAPALVVVAAIWLGATWQPMLPFLGLAAAFALLVATPSGTPSGTPAAPPPPAAPRSAGWLAYAAVLVGLDFTLPVWDLQIVPTWGPFLALGFVAAGLVVAYPGAPSAGAARAGVLVAVSSYALAALIPEFALSPLHAVVAGGALGALLGAARDAGRSPQLVPCCFLVGTLLAHVVTQQLAFAGLRGVLLLPFAWLLVRRPAAAAQRA